MAIVTISREIGAGATFIALKLAESLSYSCVDKEIIHEIAKKMGKSQEDLEDFDQDTYNRMGVFFQEALANISKGGRVFHPFGMGPLDWESVDLFPTYPQGDFKQEEYIDVLKQVIVELATRDNVVILGRAGSRILADRKNAVHVRIVSSIGERHSRIKDEQKVDDQKASDIITQRDEAARKFFWDFFDSDWADPHGYHLTLNTSLVSLEGCVSLIGDLVAKTVSA